MKISGHSRRIGIGIASAGIVAGTVVALLPSANAGQSTPLKLSAVDATELASTLQSKLGDGTAGSYYEAGKLVVNVTSDSAADTVQDAGAVAKTVENSVAELKSATGTLKKQATIPGTAWAMDPQTNQVVVTADRTVKGADLAQLNEVVDALGAKARLEKSAGEFKPFVSGGDAIFTGGARCSLGFNVIKDGAPHFITAGHCGEAGSSWSDSGGGEEIGQMVDSRFPGDDFSLVQYTAQVDAPSAVNLYNGSSQEITEAGEATVGQEVQRSGSTTQVHGGTVTGLDATVNYGNGDIVNGLIQTDVCAEPGDSGGSLFAGSTALGLTSGGSGDCTGGGETFFQPITEALSVYGAEIG